MSVALGSFWMAFHASSETGYGNSDGSITMVSQQQRPRLTQSVGATCQPHCTWHDGLFLVFASRLPCIHTFLGFTPATIISRHISLARAQQPSSGYRKGMHGAGTVSGLQVVALTKLNICSAVFKDTHRNQQKQRHHHHLGKRRPTFFSTGETVPEIFGSSELGRTSIIS